MGVKKLYQECFQIPEEGKIDESVLVGRIIMSVCVVVLCLVAMGVTAFAYFSHDITSGSNVIKAANFDVVVTVDGVPLETTAGSRRAEAALAAGEHTITVQKQNTSTAQTGFCVITIGNTVYHTQQIGAGGVEILTFTVKAEVDTQIAFLGHWGTSSRYGYSDAENDPLYIMQKDPVVQIVAGPVIVPEPEPIIYTVQKDDNLTMIADAFGTTAERLQAFNELPNINYVEENQQIKIPPADWQMPTEESNKNAE